MSQKQISARRLKRKCNANSPKQDICYVKCGYDDQIGHVLDSWLYDPRMTEPEPAVLTPTIIEPRSHELLPAIREDLAPFLPALRSVAQLIAAAAVAEFAARYAAPAMIDQARQMIAPAPQRTQTILVEEHTTVRRRVTVVS